ncbi:hypothetical protein OG749_43635 [Streptomyces nojiriensis]|uniref:hypothetical protein n=1 Tax=Streptomyces nojiriensis TaxID=66374 RepID=UPI002E19EEFD
MSIFATWLLLAEDGDAVAPLSATGPRSSACTTPSQNGWARTNGDIARTLAVRAPEPQEGVAA